MAKAPEETPDVAKRGGSGTDTDGGGTTKTGIGFQPAKRQEPPPVEEPDPNPMTGLGQ